MKTVPLTEDEQAAAFEAVFARGADVVLDDLRGPPARLILEANARIPDLARPRRLV
ncbi:hypothetical protein [Paracoccus yeei]|jgi:hypothetical protein|uniref:hypothetical protein n=1 Tax=Paracoccus yeei TaxID=147645 RepID=UPI003BF7D653